MPSVSSSGWGKTHINRSSVIVPSSIDSMRISRARRLYVTEYTRRSNVKRPNPCGSERSTCRDQAVADRLEGQRLSDFHALLDCLSRLGRAWTRVQEQHLVGADD